jgi:glutathione S-transferase
MEESASICSYFDHLDGKPALAWPGEQAWEARRLEGLARSMLDGIAVWGREIARPANEQSLSVIQHEKDRAQRMADVWEREISHALMRGQLNLIQLTLACGLGMDARNPAFRWRPGHPKLSAWHDEMSSRPSFRATEPPRA